MGGYGGGRRGNEQATNALPLRIWASTDQLSDRCFAFESALFRFFE